MARFNIFPAIVLLFAGFFISAYLSSKDIHQNKFSKTTTNDNSNYIAINECMVWFSNNGMSSHNPSTDGSGFYWPGGENASLTAIYTDGLIWGAKVGREFRVGGATYRYGLQAGKILPNGEADDPNLSKYRIYKVRKNWQAEPDPAIKAQLATDLEEWPIEDGAPWIDVNADGVYDPTIDTPDFIGDEVLWWISNDLDASRTSYLYGTLPMGIEVQTTVYAFNRTGDLGNTIFKRYRIINKGQKILDNMYIAQWSDVDLGYAEDDFVGCDTTLALGFAYNGDNNDNDHYGTAPPAIGYDLLQGPIIPYDPNNETVIRFNLPDSARFLGKWRKGYTNLPMTSFTFYINSNAVYNDPDLGVAAGSEQMYNYMTGLLWNSDPFIDPNTNNPVRYCLAGDPVDGTGWYEGAGWPGGQSPADRRILQSSGPFTMAPGDTQEVVIGILMARGTNNINSVAELKNADQSVQTEFDESFIITPPIMINDSSNYIGINECMVWFSNTGMSAHDPRTNKSGFYWPGGVNAKLTAVFSDGLLWGAKVGGSEVRVGGATYRFGLQAGKILPNGEADDPNLESNRIFKIRKNWQTETNPVLRAQLEIDLNEWPVENGAPWIDINGDNIYSYADGDTPEFIGDEMLWWVSNDLEASRTTYLYGTLPMGIEVQTTIFAFNQTGVLGNMIFKKYLLINKGQNNLDDMYIAQWADPDLGYGYDDYSGCDTTLGLGFTYNGDNTDEEYYNTPPPAIGYDFLQGPVIPYDPNNEIVKRYNLPDSAKFMGKWKKGFCNLPMTSFAFYINRDNVYKDPKLGDVSGATEMYNYMNGLLWNGNSYIDPNTGQATNFCLSGDPFSGYGWYEGPGWPGGKPPGDRRHLQSSGPFIMAPGDSQEVVIGVLLAGGLNNYESVSILKAADQYAQAQYDNNFNITSVDNNTNLLPRGFILKQNYPNPFNPTTVISFQLSVLSKVQLKIYDVLGREVATLVDEIKPSGYYDVKFDGTNLSSGVYFCRMQAGDFSDTKKLVLLK